MKFLWLIIIALLLAACTSAPTPVVTGAEATPNTAPSGDYPAPGDPQGAQSTAYPAGQAGQEPTLGPTATIDPTLGVVKGVLMQQGKPVVGADLYIADLLQSKDGKDIAYAFSQGTSPRSVTNEKGEFEFRNVPHGTHSLMLDMVIQSYLLLIPNTQDAMKFDIGTGSVIDLGVLDYDELPIP